jgi:hypothetical protein
MLDNQIDNLIISSSFAHNLCLGTQMGHASSFETSMFQAFSNDIMKYLIQWV